MRIQGLGGGGEKRRGEERREEKRREDKTRQDKTRQEKKRENDTPAYQHMNQHRLHPPRYIFPRNIRAVSRAMVAVKPRTRTVSLSRTSAPSEVMGGEGRGGEVK